MDANCTSGMDSHDNTVSALVSLAISRIRPFEYSPRRRPHEARLRLVQSIRQHGLDHALVVTQPPGSRNYVLAAGGTTRLSVLRELAAEAGGARFAKVPCVVIRWPGETELILAHLRENDLRSELVFIEQARAVAQCKRLLELDTGRSFSDDELAAQLHQRGYGFSGAIIDQMLYATGRLLEVIPAALDSGLRREAVQQIRYLDVTATHLWTAHGLDPTQPYDDTFLALCRRYDGPDWSFEDLEEAVAVEIAEAADVSIQAVRLALRAPVIDNPGALDSEVPSAVSASSDFEAQTCPSQNASRSISRAYSRGFNRPVSGERTDPEVREPGAGDYLTRPPAPALQHRDNAPLKSARARCWTLALRLATRFGLQDLVVSTPGAGLGYLLIDYPDSGFLSTLSGQKARQVQHIWDHLATCCDLPRAPREHLARRLTPGSALYSDLLSVDGRAGHVGSQINDYRPLRCPWGDLEEAAWRDYVALMDARQAAHGFAEIHGVCLWGAQ
ncbi:MAG: ParB family protein [Pseudomonadota bacterium]